jgi:tetratricopeptide (TPR) repeat protein
MDAALRELNKKDYAGAERALAPALQAHPQDPNVLSIKGAILTKQKNYDAALQCYQQTLQLSPRFLPALYNIGTLLALRQQWDDAIAYYRNLLLEEPNNDLVEYKLFLLLLHQNADSPLQEKLFSVNHPMNTPAWYYAMAARCYKKGDAWEADKYLDVVKTLYGDKVGIFQEELDESDLTTPKKK